MQTLEGIVERVVYENDESAWSVVRVQEAGQGRVVTVVGNLLGVQPGESLRLHGDWGNDPRFGRQFRADTYLSLKPATLEGMERYLGSGLVAGIGKTMAARIVDHFGLDTLEVIETQAQRLTEVEGIGGVRAARIRDAWQEQRGIKEVMLFLHSQGVTPRLAVKIYKAYGQAAVARIRENPYRLAFDIFGVGFKSADRIGERLGISRTSPRRLEAGVHHALVGFGDAGHACCLRAELVEAAASLLEVEAGLVDKAVTSLADTGWVTLETWPDLGEVVFLATLQRAEVSVAQRLGVILAEPPRQVEIHVDRALAWFQDQQGMSLAPEQAQAIRSGLDAKVLVITGGPGTGKTTIVNGIVRILEKKGISMLLAAPTGRAAKRLQEATGREAVTLHRLLDYSPKIQGFQRNRESPLKADLVILDEMSMVDIVLMQQFLQAFPDTGRLVVVGDVDQLPSVGPGNVLRDLIRCDQIEVVRLTHVFRQGARSWIVTNAHRVNQGEMPDLSGTADQGADFFFVERNEPEHILDTLGDMIRERIPNRFGVNAIQDIQVLTPMQRGDLGVANLNVQLQQLLNPDGRVLERGQRQFRVRDRVMQTRNNYDLEVFNGDIGVIDAVDTEAGELVVRYDARLVRYESSQLDELVLAYACSIHKSQGSEFPVVIVPIHTQHYVMLHRNLLYTAMTRGRRLVVLVGSKRALRIMVENHQVVERRTRLAERLRGGVPR
ncbi:MAG: ATP-dependent RecD-like DNA helicase [Planctomycetota bacterium]